MFPWAAPPIPRRFWVSVVDAINAPNMGMFRVTRVMEKPEQPHAPAAVDYYRRVWNRASSLQFVYCGQSAIE